MKLTISTFVLLFCSNLILGQTTISLDINNGSGRDLYVSSFPGWEDLNMNPDPDFAAVAWTSSGTPHIGRSMIEFDLSSIPAGATITNASLNLYVNPNPEHSIGHSTISGSNVATLRRIISPWDENTTTWNSQPSTTTQNEVFVPQSTSANQDYFGLNVTALVQDIYSDQANSYGLMLQLVTEQHYRALNFASSNCLDATKTPSLEITYTMNDCIVIPINSGSGQDLYISSFPGWENLNMNPDPDFAAVAWTSSGTPHIGRSMIEFDLSAIPAEAIITNANLNLYVNPNPEHSIGHSTISGSNVATLRRIISPWDENTTTWNSQPNTTTQNEVFVPQSTSANQNYFGLNVTALIQDIYGDQANSHGLMLQLVTEQHYRALNFASSNCLDTTKIPWLEICYSFSNNPAAINLESNEIFDFEIFPSPTSEFLTINLNELMKGDNLLEIFNAQGQIVRRQANVGKNEIVDVSKSPAGLYFIKLSVDKVTVTKKFIKE